MQSKAGTETTDTDQIQLLHCNGFLIFIRDTKVILMNNIAKSCLYVIVEWMIYVSDLVKVIFFLSTSMDSLQIEKYSEGNNIFIYNRFIVNNKRWY